METTKTTATTFSAKTERSSSGNLLQISASLAEVKPMATDRDRAAMVIFLCEKPQAAIICIPDTTMEPNIIIVHPPSTDSGREAKKFPTGGSSPARSIHTAPVMMVNRLTTLVMATRPTFWEKLVTGGQPKRPDTAEA